MQTDSTKATGWPTQRRAEAGEVCTCGRPAIVVYDDVTGWCGSPTAKPGPCPWCGATDHVARCPRYRLRPDGAA